MTWSPDRSTAFSSSVATAYMDIASLVSFEDRISWRDWLSENHLHAKEVWLAFYNKASGKGTLSYDEAVEEALCFGWIDGKKKSIDGEMHAFRFTPRSTKSRWSVLNIKRVRKLVEQGKMTKAGLESFKGHKQRATPSLPTTLSLKVKKLFQQEKLAWKNFTEMSPGYKRLCIGWLAGAKKEETQLRRLNVLISHSTENKKIKFM